MRAMAMIVHALKLFFSTGFVSAAALQAYVSSAGWLDAHGLRVAVPAFLMHPQPALAICSIVAATFTLITEIRRARHLQAIRAAH